MPLASIYCFSVQMSWWHGSVSEDSFCVCGSFHSQHITVYSLVYTIDKFGWWSSSQDCNVYYCATHITIYIIVNSLRFCLKQMSPESCTGMIEHCCSLPLCMPNDCKLCCLRMIERWWEGRVEWVSERVREGGFWMLDKKSYNADNAQLRYMVIAFSEARFSVSDDAWIRARVSM